ncbi:MAG: hypothetical protein ABIH49_02570 [archaeon]
MLNWTEMSISFFIFLMQLAILFILFEIKKRIDGKLKRTFIYPILVVIMLILLRIQGILRNADILTIPYSQEVLSFLLSLFLLLAVWSFYRSVREITDKNKSGKRRGFVNYKQKIKGRIERNKY